MALDQYMQKDTDVGFVWITLIACMFVAVLLKLFILPILKSKLVPVLISSTNDAEAISGMSNMFTFMSFIPYVLFFISAVAMLLIIFRKEQNDYYG